MTLRQWWALALIPGLAVNPAFAGSQARHLVSCGIFESQALSAEAIVSEKTALLNSHRDAALKFVTGRLMGRAAAAVALLVFPLGLSLAQDTFEPNKPLPIPAVLPLYEAQPSSLRVTVGTVDRLLRTFYESSISATQQGISLKTNDDAFKAQEIEFEHALLNALRDAILAAKDLPAAPVIAEEKAMKELKQTERGPYLMHTFFPDYFARHGLYFEFGYYTLRPGILIPTVKIRPIVSRERLERTIIALSSKPIHATLYVLGPSKVVLFTGLPNVPLPQASPYSARQGTDEVIFEPDQLDVVAVHALDVYHDLASRIPQAARDGAIPLGTIVDLRQRTVYSAFFKAVRFTIGKPLTQATDAELLQAIKSMLSEFAVRHELTHIYEFFHASPSPSEFRHPLAGNYWEIRASLAAGVDFRNPWVVFYEMGSQADITVQNYESHTSDNLFSQNRLAYWYWRQNAGIASGWAAPRPDQDEFIHLPAADQARVWISLESATADEWHAAFKAAWDEAASIHNNPFLNHKDSEQPLALQAQSVPLVDARAAASRPSLSYWKGAGGALMALSLILGYFGFVVRRAVRQAAQIRSLQQSLPGLSEETSRLLLPGLESEPLLRKLLRKHGLPLNGVGRVLHDALLRGHNAPWKSDWKIRVLAIGAAVTALAGFLAFLHAIFPGAVLVGSLQPTVVRHEPRVPALLVAA